LEGWDVKALDKPDEDGEMEKYTTYWGHGCSMLSYSHALGPCGRDACAWNQLSDIQRRLELRGVRPLSMAHVFKVWQDKRARIRERGGFAL
jgi:hypothetical protein